MRNWVCLVTETLDWKNVDKNADKIRMDKNKQADSGKISLESLLVATSLISKGP